MRAAGRPPLPPTRPRVQLSCVIPAHVKTKLLIAAKHNGVTVASEVATRLIVSFSKEQRLADIKEALRSVLEERGAVE